MVCPDRSKYCRALVYEFFDMAELILMLSQTSRAVQWLLHLPRRPMLLGGFMPATDALFDDLALEFSNGAADVIRGRAACRRCVEPSVNDRKRMGRSRSTVTHLMRWPNGSDEPI